MKFKPLCILPSVRGLLLLSGCSSLDECAQGPDLKTRAAPLPETSWDAIEAQDIAILLPRVVGEGISGATGTGEGRRLLPSEWLEAVSSAFEETEVEDALESENFEADWELVAVRIAPCSPLGKIPGPIAEAYCWPEVRLVWQPNMYEYFIGWTTVDAFSDDRAIHARYRVYPEGLREEVDDLIARMARDNRPLAEDLARLAALRENAVAQLLGDVLALRSSEVSPTAFSQLDLRSETLDSDQVATRFYQRLASFLGAYADKSRLHTLTAFSLPEGREPATIDRWTFLAFDGIDGQLVQRPITVADPETGRTAIDYGMDETVSSAAADDSVMDALENGQNTEFIRRQILTSPEDRARLADRINDPSQTLVPNTSCATCHSLNELTFDFHNLSYLQEMEMTISTRVRNDVRAELSDPDASLPIEAGGLRRRR